MRNYHNNTRPITAVLQLHNQKINSLYTTAYKQSIFWDQATRLHQCTYNIVLLAPHSFTWSTITQGYHQPNKGRDVSKFCVRTFPNAWCWKHFRIFWGVYVCLLIDISANFDDLANPRMGNISVKYLHKKYLHKWTTFVTLHTTDCSFYNNEPQLLFS